MMQNRGVFDESESIGDFGCTSSGDVKKFCCEFFGLVGENGGNKFFAPGENIGFLGRMRWSWGR